MIHMGETGHRCDILIAAWDSAGETVAEALRPTLALFWHAGNHNPATNQPTSLDEEQSKEPVEHFPTWPGP